MHQRIVIGYSKTGESESLSLDSGDQASVRNWKRSGMGAPERGLATELAVFFNTMSNSYTGRLAMAPLQAETDIPQAGVETP